MFLICLIYSFSLDFVHIISAQCTKVDIRFVFCLVELKDSQRKYCPVKVGFLYTLVSKPVTVCSTLRVETINTLIFSGSSHFDAIATDESVTKSLWLRKNRLCLKRSFNLTDFLFFWLSSLDRALIVIDTIKIYSPILLCP